MNMQAGWLKLISSSLQNKSGLPFEQTWISNMLCAKFDWNCPQRSREEDFKISSMYNYLPLDKDEAIHLKKLESPSTKHA